jgi:hypothetical protein
MPSPTEAEFLFVNPEKLQKSKIFYFSALVGSQVVWVNGVNSSPHENHLFFGVPSNKTSRTSLGLSENQDVPILWTTVFRKGVTHYNRCNALIITQCKLFIVLQRRNGIFFPDRNQRRNF